MKLFLSEEGWQKGSKLAIKFFKNKEKNLLEREGVLLCLIFLLFLSIGMHQPLQKWRKCGVNAKKKGQHPKILTWFGNIFFKIAAQYPVVVVDII